MGKRTSPGSVVRYFGPWRICYSQAHRPGVDPSVSISHSFRPGYRVVKRPAWNRAVRRHGSSEIAAGVLFQQLEN